MADFNWNALWQGTLGGIASALGGPQQPQQQAATTTVARPAGGIADYMPILLAAGVGLVALIFILKK